MIAIFLIIVATIIILVLIINSNNDDSNNVIRCTRNKDCPSGQVCLQGICQPKLGCMNDADCGQGQVCRNNICVTGRSRSNRSRIRRDDINLRVRQMDTITTDVSDEILQVVQDAIRSSTNDQVKQVQPAKTNNEPKMNVVPSANKPNRFIPPKISNETKMNVVPSTNKPNRFLPPKISNGQPFMQTQPILVHSQDSTDCYTGDDSYRNDAPFDMRSNTSSCDFSCNSPGTPYTEGSHAYYCQHRDVSGKVVLTKEGSDHVVIKEKRLPVVDVCSYSESVVYLMENGDIINELPNGKKMQVKNNVKLDRLEFFAGYLHGVGNGTLYRLDNSAYTTDSKKWTWESCEWSPIGILFTSATFDGNYLWLQTAEVGMLFDNEHKVVDEEYPNDNGKIIKRYYGVDRKNYLRVDEDTCTAVSKPDDRPMHGVCGGVLTYHGEVIPITEDMRKKYSHARLVRWKPHFIYRNKK